jgi:hypothetical protein
MIVTSRLPAVACLLFSLGFYVGCGEPPNLPADMVGVYRYDAPQNDDVPRHYTLDLRSDFSSTLTSQFIGKGTLTEKGSWTNRETMVILTFKALGRSKNTNLPPNVFEMAWSRKKLTSAKWDKALYGEDGPGTFLRTTNRSPWVVPPSTSAPPASLPPKKAKKADSKPS